MSGGWANTQSRNHLERACSLLGMTMRPENHPVPQLHSPKSPAIIPERTVLDADLSRTMRIQYVHIIPPSTIQYWLMKQLSLSHQ